MEEKIVSNANSLIFLGKLGIFNFLRNLYSKVFVPEEVIDEIFKYDKPENVCIKGELNSGFLESFKVDEIREFPVNIGEGAALSLCIEKNIFVFLSDLSKKLTTPFKVWYSFAMVFHSGS